MDVRSLQTKVLGTLLDHTIKIRLLVAGLMLAESIRTYRRVFTFVSVQNLHCDARILKLNDQKVSKTRPENPLGVCKRAEKTSGFLLIIFSPSHMLLARKEEGERCFTVMKLCVVRCLVAGDTLYSYPLK